MQVDIRGLENIIRCDYPSCNSNVLNGRVVILKPCFLFYCESHIICRKKSCQLCDKYIFATKQPSNPGNSYCFITTMIDSISGGDCEYCNRKHRNYSEFSLRYDYFNLDGFIEAIREIKDTLNIDEVKPPRKKVSRSNMYGIQPSTIEMDYLNLTVREIAEKFITRARSDVNRMLKKLLTTDYLKKRLNEDFENLYNDLDVRAMEIKDAYHSRLNSHMDEVVTEKEKNLTKRWKLFRKL